MTPEAPRFIHLRVRTALSLLQSMIRPKDLAKWAAGNAAPAVAVTDDNLFAALELAEALTEQGVFRVLVVGGSQGAEERRRAPRFAPGAEEAGPCRIKYDTNVAYYEARFVLRKIPRPARAGGAAWFRWNCSRAICSRR